MINGIEIKNFQSHKHTKIDFTKGVNVFCGESDNGKTAIIRAIRWVVENRPLGTDKLNSYWNENFKEDMSVKLFLENNQWVERIRNKTLNGYRFFNNEKEITLEASGKEVPQVISDMLRFSDVNFQFQMDSPYLISMTSGDASKYLNKIIHLDVIDNTLSVAESDKRNLNAEKKIIEKDIIDYQNKIENLSWLDEANTFQKRIEHYDESIGANKNKIETLKKSIEKYESCEVLDLTEQNTMIQEIENIKLNDVSELKKSIETYEEYSKKYMNLERHKKYIEKIGSLKIYDTSKLQKSIENYEFNLNHKLYAEEEIKNLKNKLPHICPLCGHALD